MSRGCWISLGIVGGLLVLGGLLLVGLAVAVMGSSGDGLAGQDAVGIIYVEGPIQSEDSTGFTSSTVASSRRIVGQLEQVERNRAVKAVVLRINSPGGGIVASDEIYRAVKRLQASGKVVVAAMGDTAASGGYYVAAPADRIIANPGTITGSIGVIGTLPNVEGLLDKVGVRMTVIKSGPHKDEGSPFRSMTEEERGIYQGMIDEMYQQFVGVVSEGRRMEQAQVLKLADGRIYTGKQAKDLGLVDELGDTPRAIEAAAELAGISGKPRIIEYRRSSWLDAFFGTWSESARGFNLDRFLGVERRFTLQYLWLGY